MAFGRLGAEEEDSDENADLRDGRAGEESARRNYASQNAHQLQQPQAPRQRAQTSASMQLPAGVAASLAQLTVRNLRASTGAAPLRPRLAPLVDAGAHLFVRLSKREPPALVTCYLTRTPAVTNGSTTAASCSLCIAPYVAAPMSPSSSKRSAGLAVQASAASSVAGSRMTPPVSPTAAAALAAASAAASLGGSSSLDYAGMVLPPPQFAHNPSAVGGSGNSVAATGAFPFTASPPQSSSSASNGQSLQCIPAQTLLSVLRGFKSKKLQALQSPAELEPAAFTITYLETSDAGAGKEAKKKHVHLLALQSRSATAWCGALESLCATPAAASSASSSPVRSLEDAQRAATTATLGFDSGAESNVRFHSLLAKHYSHLHLPVLLRQSSSDATADLQQQLLQQQQVAAAPQLPSRRKSAFHSDYLSTKGFTAAPSHARSLTLSMLNTAAAAASSGTSATGSPLASPTLARTLDDVLPLLRRGCYFLKFGRSGPPKFRFLVLSEDLLTLCPYERRDDVGGKAPAKAIDLRSIARLHLGHYSPRFTRSGLGVSPSLAPLCWSIQLRSDPTDQPAKHTGPAFLALNSRTFHIWTRGLVQLKRLADEFDAAETQTQMLQQHASMTEAAQSSRPAEPHPSAIGWPPASLPVDLPLALDGEGSDTDWTDLSGIKGVDMARWQRVQQEMELITSELETR